MSVRLNHVNSLIFPVLHLAFLFSLIESENGSMKHNYLSYNRLWLGLGILCLIGMKTLYPRQADLRRNYTDILMVILGGTTTFFLSQDLKLGPVIAAGIVGVLASFLPSLYKKHTDTLKLASFSIYCGAFVGMSSTLVFDNYAHLTLASLFAGIIYVWTTRSFNGIGGKHGTIAFAGVFILKTLLDVVA